MNTIETKVITATAGSGLGAALSGFLLWLLGITADGQGGAHTRWALGEQQRLHHVAQDYIFGPATASALLAN